MPLDSLSLPEAPVGFPSSCERRVCGAASSTSETNDESPENPFLSEFSVTGLHRHLAIPHQQSACVSKSLSLGLAFFQKIRIAASRTWMLSMS